MPTFQLQVRTASGYDEVSLVKDIFASTKEFVRDVLDTESYPIDPQTGVSGTCVEVNLMDGRFDQILTVDALEKSERLVGAQERVDELCRKLKAISGKMDKIGVWLNLGGHKFWASTYTLEQ